LRYNERFGRSERGTAGKDSFQSLNEISNRKISNHIIVLFEKLTGTYHPRHSQKIA